MARAALAHERLHQQVDRTVLVLFASVIESLGWATAALLDQDVETADRVINDDRMIDERCRELTGVIRDHLSEAEVVPGELDDLVTLLQMVPELERSADLAEHIAQRARQDLGGNISPRCRGLIQSMCDVGTRMWQLSSRAYAERSRDLSFDISDADDELDNLSAELLREGAVGGVESAVAVELALVARFYERLGDHAVNLARRSAAMAAPLRKSPLRALSKRRRHSAEGPAQSDVGALARLSHLRLVPTDQGFFELFSSAASNARECAEELQKMIASHGEDSITDECYRQVRMLERRGHQITVQLLRRLDSTFVTPFDREDILALIEELDDVVDETFSAADLVHLLNVSVPLPEVGQLADTMVSMASEMEGLVQCLETRRGGRHRLERIETLEREGDAARRRSIARLFSGEFDALDVLRWKDILQALEHSMHRIEDVSDVVEFVLLKSS